MHQLSILAGIAFDPGIRGILVVMVGVGVLMGSVYLLLGTNLGSRLGFLVALAGLFGWLAILTFMWWLTPPAIGPRGAPPSFKAVEIYVNGTGETPKTIEVAKLTDPNALPTANKILADNPDLAKDFPNGFTLSDLKGTHSDIVDQYIDSESLQGWKLVSAASAGEAQAAGDVVIIESGIFKTNADYKKLNVWQYGGKPTLAQDCPDGGITCRVWHRVSSALQIKNPPNFSVVQIQQVIPQEIVPGQAPPIPRADTSKPVYSIVMARVIGNERVIPFLYFVICMSLFVLTAWMLHIRDKTLMKNKALAAAALKES